MKETGKKKWESPEISVYELGDQGGDLLLSSEQELTENGWDTFSFNSLF